MITFYAIELGRGVVLPDDLSLRAECDWLLSGQAKKGAFSNNFTLSATEVATAFFGGTLKAVEKRFSVYGRLSSGGRSWLGQLQCTSYSEGVYQCTFIERPKDIWDEKVYRLATLPPLTSYNDIYSEWNSDGNSPYWHQPVGVNYARCAMDYPLQSGCFLPRVRLDLVVDVINSMQGLKIPVQEWMQTRWVYCCRGHIYSEDVTEGEEFDWDSVAYGTQYPILWNLPNVSLYEFLSRLAMSAGYGTYVDGDAISFVDYANFKPSGALNVGERFIEGQSAAYGLVSNIEGRVVTVNGTEVASVTASDANGTAAGVGDIMTLEVYWSNKESAYVVLDDNNDYQFSDGLDTDAIVLTSASGVAGFASVKAFMQMAVKTPKKATYLLFGDDFKVWQPQYVPQLDATYLPISLTSQTGVTKVEGLLIADYEPEQLADWEYIFTIDEGEEQVAPEFYASLGAETSVTCGKKYPLLVTSAYEGAFAPYKIEFEWQNATVEASWLSFMMDIEDEPTATVSEEGLVIIVSAQSGVNAINITPPLYAAIRIRLTQLATGLVEVVVPPFTQTPITDYTFSLIGVHFEEPSDTDRGGEPTFVIRYTSHAAQGCMPLPADVDLYAIGCNVNNNYSQTYDAANQRWEIRSKAVWPSAGSTNEVMAWDQMRTHYFGSYTAGIRYRLTREGTTLQAWTDYYAPSLFYNGRRALGSWVAGTLAPSTPGYKHESGGRWLIWDGVRNTWSQYNSSDTFTLAGVGFSEMEITSGTAMTRQGVNARVSLNVFPQQGYCYGTGAPSGLDGPWCYLIFVERYNFPNKYYNRWDRTFDNMSAITRLADNWQARWRMRYNSTSISLDQCDAYPPSSRCQGVGRVTNATNGTIACYPLIIVDLSTGYVPANTKWELPIRVQLNNASA